MLSTRKNQQTAHTMLGKITPRQVAPLLSIDKLSDKQNFDELSDPSIAPTSRKDVLSLMAATPTI